VQQVPQVESTILQSESFISSAPLKEKAQSINWRNKQYRNMLIDALKNPLAQVRYIYFGLIMGISASLPTCMHIFMAFASLCKTRFRGT